MLRLPSQFEPTPSHTGESAAAGGCSTTTCTCCVVSFGAAAILTSTYFVSLATSIPGEEGASGGEGPIQDISEPAKAQAHASDPQHQPVTGQDLPMPVAPGGSSSKALLGLLGFFTPLLALGAAIGGLALSDNPLTLSLPLFLLVWFAGFVLAHRLAGFHGPRFFLAGLGALIVLGVAIAVEINIWWS